MVSGLFVVIGARRASWRIVSSIEGKEEVSTYQTQSLACHETTQLIILDVFSPRATPRRLPRSRVSRAIDWASRARLVADPTGLVFIRVPGKD